MWDSSGAQSDDCDSLQLISWFWYSEIFDGCCPRLPIPIVPQPQPESRPQEHCLEQQARIHHPNSHLLLHWPLLLPDNHRWRHAQVTCILCTQTRSAVHTFLFNINAKKTLNPLWILYIFLSLSFSFSSQWVTSWMYIWTAVDPCRPWRERDWSWTALPLGSWTPESTSPGTTPERSGLH